MMRVLALIVVLPVTGLLAWWGVSGPPGGKSSDHEALHRVARRTFQVTLQEKGELKAANSIDIKCEVEGRSTIISLIPEGTQVKKGDLLVELASDKIDDKIQAERIQVANADAALESTKQQLEILQDQNVSDIDKTKLKLTLAELDLKKYEQGQWPQQLQDAEFRVKEADKVLAREAEDLKASQTLVEKNYITRTEYDQDEFNLYKAQVELQKARRDLEILKEFTHVKDLQQKRSDVTETRKELARVIKEARAKENEKRANLQAKAAELELKQQRLTKLEHQKEKTKILAPADGMVVYGDGSSGRWYNNSNQIKEGAEVFERQTILQLPDTSQMKVVIRVHEAKTDRLRLGQQAVVVIEGIRGEQFMGQVTKIAALADSQNRWLNPDLKEYETEILLDRAHALLKPGLTARAEILIKELHDVVAVPIQSVFSKGHRNFVFVANGSDAEPVQVEVGLASTDFVEIKSGLKQDQWVLLAVTDDLTIKLPESPRRGRMAERAQRTRKPQKAQKAPTGESPKPSARAPRHQRSTHGGGKG